MIPTRWGLKRSSVLPILTVFGESNIDEIAAVLGMEVLGKMQIDPELAKMVEEERFYEVKHDYLKDAVEALA